MPRFLDAESLGRPIGHYSHAAIANGFVFISGLLPIRPDGTKMNGETLASQTQQILANLGEILSAAGSTPEHLVQVRVYIGDTDYWPIFNRLYADWIGPSRPARCVVPVPALHYDLDIEIEAVALQAGPDL
jgi:reactive intermediate/imine deaminase